MGQQIVAAIRDAPGLSIAEDSIDDGTFGKELLLDQGDDLGFITPANSGGNTDVVVEITVAGASPANVRKLLSQGVKHIVVGTSGWKQEDIEDLALFLSQDNDLYGDVKVVIIPNFSISAVLQEKWTLEAAQYFNDAHIIEYHHKAKIDKPSGTALRLQDELQKSPNAHGDKVRPEALSVRADGYMATQEVILTNFGERLKIEQDVTSRDAFMPGVILSIRSIISDKVQHGVTVGLGELLK
jgi:4-hydroxy-tetrahydrodipicolinate reductase